MKPLPRILFTLAIAGFLLAGAAMVLAQQSNQQADTARQRQSSDSASQEEAADPVEEAVNQAAPGNPMPTDDGNDSGASDDAAEPSFAIVDPQRIMQLDSFNDFWNLELLRVSGQPVYVNQLVAALLLLLVGLFVSWWIQAWIRRLVARRSPAREHTAAFIATLVFLFMSVVVIVTTLAVLGIPITAFAFLGGALAIGLGFGLQNILNNFVSGIILMSEGQFRIGDVVEVNDQLATVEQIGARSSRIKRFDGIDLIVPNSQIIDNTVVNRTLSDDLIRNSIMVGIAYGSPTRKAEELLVEAGKSVEGVLKEPAPVAIFQEFGDNALIFELFVWCRMGRRTPFDIRIIRSDIRHKIDELFRDAQITIAFPQRDVHLDTLGEPLHVKIDKGDGEIPGDEPPSDDTAPGGKTPHGGSTMPTGDKSDSGAQQEE